MNAAMIEGLVKGGIDGLRSEDRATAKACSKALLVSIFDTYQSDEATRQLLGSVAKQLMEYGMAHYMAGTKVGAELQALLDALQSNAEPWTQKLGALEMQMLRSGCAMLEQLKAGMASDGT